MREGRRARERAEKKREKEEGKERNGDRVERVGVFSAGHTLAHTYVQNICRKLLGCDFTRVTTTQI